MFKGIRLRLIAALTIVAASLSLGLWLLPSDAPAVASTGTAAPAAAAAAAQPRAFTLRPNWPVGTRYVYALEWRSQQKLLPPMLAESSAQAKALAGSMRLSGELVLRSLGGGREAFLLGASLENVREAQFHIDEQVSQDMGTLKEAFTGHEVLLEVDASGALRTFHFDPKSPDFFKHQMQWLLTHAQPSLPVDPAQGSSGRWEAVEATSLGQARAAYEVDARQPLAVNRVRTAYTQLYVAEGQRGQVPQQLQSNARFTFAEAGHLASLSHQESLVAHSEAGEQLVDSVELLQLILRQVEHFTPPADVGLTVRTEQRKPGVIAVSASLERRMLEQRVAGLTVEQLVEDLLTNGQGGVMPDMNRWLWRATGLLKLEPARSRELVAVFESPELGSQARAVVLDLLVGAGHAQAQAVLREVLDSKVAREDKANYTLFVQRLGLVSKPEPETLEYLSRKHTGARAGQEENVRKASAYALGAAVGQLAVDDAQAGTYNQQLRDELAAAKTGADRVTYLRSLGNAGRPENVSAVLPHVADPDAAVRAAVAAALRKTDTPESTQALLQLVRASERSVQAEALAALRERYLEPRALASLRDVVLAGGLRQGTEPLLVSLLAERLTEGPEVFQMLQALERKSQQDPALRGRVMELMAQLSRQP